MDPKDTGAPASVTKTPAPAAPNPVEPAAKPHPVDVWVEEKLRNSVVARNTEVWNYLASVLPDLKAALGE